MDKQKSPKQADIIVGSNVRQRRVMLGMSQEKLGEALDITFQQIQKYEKGTNRVSASKLVDMALILKCNIADLFAGTEGAATPAVQTAPLYSAEALRIAGNIDKLPVTQRRALARLVTAMANAEEDQDDTVS